MASSKFDESLREEAAALVQNAHSDRDARLLEWSSRSAAHARELERALQLANLSSQLSPQFGRTSDRFVVPLQIFWLRLLERKTGVALVMVTLFGIALALHFQTAQTGDRSELMTSSTPATAHTTSFSTRHRQQHTVTLVDGSTIWLDWNTELSVRFDDNHRLVEIERGAAAFKVASNAQRPFVVKAGALTTLVTGTEFTVRRQFEQQVQVAVLEGRVRVSTEASKSISLEAGQVIQSRADRLGNMDMQSVQTMGTWRDGILVFDDMPLLEALQSLEPYTSYRLNTDGLRGISGRITGTYNIHRADASLTAILTQYGITSSLESRNLLRLQQPKLARPQYSK